MNAIEFLDRLGRNGLGGLIKQGVAAILAIYALWIIDSRLSALTDRLGAIQALVQAVAQRCGAGP